MPSCLISFGANLGARQSAIVSAIRSLSGRPGVSDFRTSRLYETPPIGGPAGQEPFLNGVAAMQVDADAWQVLDWLQTLEQQLGRQRHARWSARRIDLDVVLHGHLVGGSTDLTVPHPRYTARRFVLRPACDVAAHVRDPRFGWTLAQLARHIEGGNPSLALVGCDAATRAELCQLLQSRHRIATFAEADLPTPMTVIANAPGGWDGRQQPDQTAGRPASCPTTAPTRWPLNGVGDSAWVAAFAGPLPAWDDPLALDPGIPRLLARIAWTRPEDRWPAPHSIWPSSSRWPEYRLEVDDLSWAADEIASALQSMRCPIRPVTDDGNWWQ